EGGRVGGMEWSWGLLLPYEQAAFLQCAVFQGGFTLEAAAAILDLSGFPEAPWVADVLQALCEKSLLCSYDPAEAPPERRFTLYTSVRDFALQGLAARGEIGSAPARHAPHFLGA